MIAKKTIKSNTFSPGRPQLEQTSLFVGRLETTFSRQRTLQAFYQPSYFIKTHFLQTNVLFFNVVCFFKFSCNNKLVTTHLFFAPHFSYLDTLTSLLPLNMHTTFSSNIKVINKTMVLLFASPYLRQLSSNFTNQISQLLIYFQSLAEIVTRLGDTSIKT